MNGFSGGNSTVGTINSSGLYTAPMDPPSPNRVIITATSVAASSSRGSAIATINNPAPSLGAISPASVDALSASSTISVAGDGFAPQSVVTMEGKALQTAYGAPTKLTATLPSLQLGASGSFAVTVVTPSPGGGTSNSVNLTVLLTVAVTPSVQSLAVKEIQQFTASVLGSTNGSVTWSVNGTTGGNTTVGTISASGFYTAPSVVPNPNTVKVEATSVADPTQSGSASVTLLSGAPAHSVAIAWDEPVAINGVTITGYNIYRLDVTSTIPPPPCPAPTTTFSKVGSTTSLSFTDTSVVGGHTYCYYGTALAGSVESAPSNISTPATVPSP